MTDLRAAAEALLQTAQIHQHNFETISTELRDLHQRQAESNQRFEIMLAELRQLRMEGEERFNRMQAEIQGLRIESQRMLDRLLNQQNDSEAGQ